MKEIYFAAGCFWGAEKYFKLVDGVLSTGVGFANGNTPDPTYRQVCTDTTGYAETVRIVYDPLVISLVRLVELYFLAVDPESLNKQGEDEGTRYRTGIYYKDPEDLPAIRAAYDAEAAKHPVSLAVELEPLRNFYPAEEYHQDYLEKKPDGYCHLPVSLYKAVSDGAGRKKKQYKEVRAQLASLLEGESDPVARMADFAAVLHGAFGFWWTGFYRVDGDTLVLGPFQGPVACLRIPFGRGVCGTAWKEDRTMVVPDVERFPGHIACSSLSRSEIVVPLRGPGGAVRGVLDIDSKDLSAFDSTDALCLESLVSLL